MSPQEQIKKYRTRHLISPVNIKACGEFHCATDHFRVRWSGHRWYHDTAEVQQASLASPVGFPTRA